jgi:hypothetical protein
MDLTNSEWNWLLSFPGILSIVSVAIIVVVGTALYRDWRRDRMKSSDGPSPEREWPT